MTEMSQDLGNGAESSQVAAYGRMSPARKWEEVERMRALAMDLKKAALRSAHPEWDQARVDKRVREIFLYATT